MKTTKKLLLIPILIVVLAYIFIILNIGVKINQISQVIQPLIFAVSVVICIFSSKFRKYIIQLSLVLLLFMVLSYLFNFLEISNWVGSLGFGLLFITVFSYVPKLIKKGYIEKF